MSPIELDSRGAKALRQRTAALAAAGARVIINGRDAERLERVAREIAEVTGATVIPIAADVGRSMD